MRQLFLTASVLLLTACDIAYGVRRSAYLQVDPTPECVEKVLRNTSGISSVEHEQVDGGRPITFSGIHPATIVQNFFYKGPNHVSGVLQYTKDYDGNLEFWQSSMGLNYVPPQEDITATRPVMRRVEVALEHECGLAGFAEHITEWCHK